MLQINSVEYKNLFSTGNTPTFINFKDYKNTLIIGKNGSGKSSISSALVYALYGKDFRGVKKNGMINSINNKKLLTTCEFQKNGKAYKVVRGIKPDVLEIYENNILLNAESSKKEQQDKFERDILQFPYNSFKQIVVTGSGQYIPFMKLSAPQRRDFIENLLNLGIFSSMQNRLKDVVNEEKEKEKDLKNKIYLNFEKMKIFQKESEANKERSKEKINDLENEISNIDNEILKLNDEIKTIQENLNILDVKLNSLDDTSSNEYITQKRIIDNDLLKITSFIDKIEHIDNCPTCRQKVTLEYKKEIKSSYENDLQDFRTKLNVISEQIEKIDKVQNIRTIIINKINALNNSIISVQNNIKIKNNDRLNIQNQISDILKDDKNFDVDISHLKKELQKDKKSLDKVLENLSLYNYAALILKDTGIKANIIKEYVGVINQLVNSYLERFEFFVNFNIDENFNETIKSRHRDEFTYENFSEGEKARIDLALLCTFREIAKKQSNLDCNLLILDEIFSSELDFDGVDQLKSCLESMESVNIVAISHDQTLIEKEWNRVIKFSKEGNFSTMEEII